MDVQIESPNKMTEDFKAFGTHSQMLCDMQYELQAVIKANLKKFNSDLHPMKHQ